MREIDSSLIRDDRFLMLLTARSLTEASELKAADFRDIEAVVYLPTGSYLGVDSDGNVRLGKRPLELVDGVWFMEEDAELRRGHTDVSLAPELLALELIH